MRWLGLGSVAPWCRCTSLITRGSFRRFEKISVLNIRLPCTKTPFGRVPCSPNEWKPRYGAPPSARPSFLLTPFISSLIASMAPPQNVTSAPLISLTWKLPEYTAWLTHSETPS